MPVDNFQARSLSAVFLSVVVGSLRTPNSNIFSHCTICLLFVLCCGCRGQIADIFQNVHMADQPPRTATGVSSCVQSSTAPAKNRTSSASTEIVTSAPSHSSHPSSTSMAIPTSSNSSPRLSLELEHDLDSYPLRNELTAVLQKITTRQSSKDKPLDVAEDDASDWKRVANDVQEITRWLPTQTETNCFTSGRVEPDVTIGSGLSSAFAPSTPTPHHGGKERPEGISFNCSLNPQQEQHQWQHYSENVSLVPRTRNYTPSASGSQDQVSRSNTRSSAEHDTPSALQGYASSSAVSNSQQQNREYVSHTESTRRHAASPYPPPAYRRLLTTQRDTPFSLPGIASSLALSTSQQENSENASLGQTTSDYGSSPSLQLPSTMDHSSPAAKADLLSYDHKAFCELIKTARERAHITQKRLASILCISYGAKFPNTQHSIKSFRRRLFSDAKMNSLYLIFKAWLDDVDRNVNPPRDTSTTKLRSGRACKLLSQYQYAVLTDEFAQDHWPSAQKLAELANSFAVTTKPYGIGLTHNGPRRILEELNRAVNMAPANRKIHKTKEWKISMEMKRILLKSLTPNDKYLRGHVPKVIGNLLINNPCP